MKIRAQCNHALPASRLSNDYFSLWVLRLHAHTWRHSHSSFSMGCLWSITLNETQEHMDHSLFFLFTLFFVCLSLYMLLYCIRAECHSAKPLGQPLGPMAQSLFGLEPASESQSEFLTWSMQHSDMCSQVQQKHAFSLFSHADATTPRVQLTNRIFM